MKRFWLYVPIVGRALRAAFAYRWIAALRLEFSAGMSLYRAVGDAWRASGFVDCERLGKEGEEAMRAGASLSELVKKWSQLPRDWIDFIETGEISGEFDAAFNNLEAEAARNWMLAQQHMANWLPKIVYFVALLVVACKSSRSRKQGASSIHRAGMKDNRRRGTISMSHGFYESDEAVAQYLLFHYGTPEQICPLLPDARAACGFPARCVTETLRHIELRRRGRALDLGCAVGRSSFELARHFDEVLGLDFSARFIAAARAHATRARRHRARPARRRGACDELRLELPRRIARAKTSVFAAATPARFAADLGTFDFVLMANLIDRLPDPARCLAQLPDLDLARRLARHHVALHLAGGIYAPRKMARWRRTRHPRRVAGTSRARLLVATRVSICPFSFANTAANISGAEASGRGRSVSLCLMSQAWTSAIMTADTGYS